MSQPELGYALREKVAELSGTLLSRHPSMPGLLKQIHSTIQKYPEQVTLLSPDEVRVIFNGLELQTQTFLASQTVGAKGKSNKSLAQKILNLGDDAL